MSLDITSTQSPLSTLQGAFIASPNICREGPKQVYCTQSNDGRALFVRSQPDLFLTTLSHRATSCPKVRATCLKDRWIGLVFSNIRSALGAFILHCRGHFVHEHTRAALSILVHSCPGLDVQCCSYYLDWRAGSRLRDLVRCSYPLMFRESLR